MKVFKIVLILLTAFIATIFIAGFAVGGEWRSEVKANLPASPMAVNNTVRDLATWQEWTAWNQHDYPDTKRSFSTPATGVNATMTWDDGAMTGTVKITDLNTERMDYFVTMAQNGGDWRNEFACSFTTAASDNGGSDVIWACWGNSGSYPITRLIAKYYEGQIRKDFAKGIANLKAQLSN